MEDQLTITQRECTRLLLENRALKAAMGLAAAHSQVRDFNEKFDVPVMARPTIPETVRRYLRMDLIEEEAGELLHAIDTCDIPLVADGIADTIYVCLGAALDFGIPIVEIWEEVHRTNMLKMKTSNGAKIMKPEGWQPPQIDAIIERAR